MALVSLAVFPSSSVTSLANLGRAAETISVSLVGLSVVDCLITSCSFASLAALASVQSSISAAFFLAEPS